MVEDDQSGVQLNDQQKAAIEEIIARMAKGESLQLSRKQIVVNRLTYWSGYLMGRVVAFGYDVIAEVRDRFARR